MSDGYRKGYEQGKTDARSGTDRDMRPPLGEAVLKGKNFTDTYIEGYKEGYKEAKKDQR